MRRRRQKNPLLIRIIGISILAHIIALPILAHFGAFKRIQREFLETRMVVLPPPKLEQDRPEVKKQRVAHKTPSARKSASNMPHTQTAHHSNPNQPKVVASNSNGDSGDDDGPTVDNSGTLQAGQLGGTQNNGSKATTGNNSTTAQPTAPPTTQKVTAPQIAQNTTPSKVTAPPPPPVVQHDPVYTDAVPTSSPQPTIPDDLRADALDKTFVAEFMVGADGTPTEVKVAQSTGNDELDRIALATARQWRFKPATRDGQPIESRVRLHIEFQVS
jgi:protein TonB